MISVKHLAFTALLTAASSTTVFAKVKIPFGEREVVKKVHDLPDTEEFKLKDGSFIDLATLHKEFNIAYLLPLYILEEPKLVGYNEKTETFYEIPQTEMDAMLASQKLNKAELNTLPFYTKYGGKMVAVLIIGLLVWGLIPSKKGKVQPKNI